MDSFPLLLHKMSDSVDDWLAGADDVFLWLMPRRAAREPEARLCSKLKRKKTSNSFIAKSQSDGLLETKIGYCTR